MGNRFRSNESIATASGAESLVQQSIDEFSWLDVLVNDAGILRDSFIAGDGEVLDDRQGVLRSRRSDFGAVRLADADTIETDGPWLIDDIAARLPQ